VKLSRLTVPSQNVVLRSFPSLVLLPSPLVTFAKPGCLGEGEESPQVSPFKQPNGPYSCILSTSVSYLWFFGWESVPGLVVHNSTEVLVQCEEAQLQKTSISRTRFQKQ
jgi:hypothetical protein